MSAGTIFFSYSRQDSEFVLHLAKSLREAGATIWLDQLDIKPGSRWDKSIENALFNSKTLIVVLSKSSVDSQNVLDEVSYALEENKKVVPILLEDCDIPFRLRRLQFADFTQDKKLAINTLIRSLGLDTRTATKLTTSAAEHNLITNENEPKIVNTKFSETEPKKQELKPPKAVDSKYKTVKKKEQQISKKTLFISAGVLVAAASVWAIIAFSSGTFYPDQETDLIFNEDLSDWNAIKDKSVVQLFQNHLEFYEHCAHEEEAASKIHSLISDTPQNEEENDSVAETSDKNPERNIKELEKEKWDSILALDKFKSYLEYYRRPESNYKKEASIAINKYLPKEGYVHYGSRNKNYFNPILSPTEEGVPETDTYYIASEPRTIRASYDSKSKNYGIIKGSVGAGSLVFVEQVITLGSSYWIKIRFESNSIVN